MVNFIASEAWVYNYVYLFIFIAYSFSWKLNIVEQKYLILATGPLSGNH